MKAFFQSVGVLVGYNFALPYYLSFCKHVKEVAVEFAPWSFFMGGFYYLVHGRKLRPIPRIPIRTLDKITSKYNILHLNWLHYVVNHQLLNVNVRGAKIYTHHGSGRYLSPYELKGLQSIVDKVDAFVVPSHFVAKNLRQIIGYKPLVIHHGVDPRIHNVMLDKGKAKKCLGISNNEEKIVLWNARMSPEKDLEILLDAIPMILRSIPNTSFLIKGRTVRERKRIIAKLKETKRNFKRNVMVDISWTPYHKMVYHYRCADVFVHTSLDEAFGLTLVEAMACGTPVVAANTATAPEILGNAGILFTPHDQHDLAEKVVKVLIDEKLKGRLSQAGIERIEKCGFTWKDAAKKYASLYSSLL